MATRFTARPVDTFGVAPIPTGVDNTSVPDGLTIPSCGLEDVDVALFELFQSEIKLAVKDNDGIKPVPVLFAAGEKWAMLKKGRAVRDKHGTLILPLVTIGRNNVQQLTNEDQAGRGINQQTGDLVIKRRLSPTDRSYQKLVNRLLLQNQNNVAMSPETAQLPDQLTTLRDIGDMSNDLTVERGGLLTPNVLNNAWEIISIPSPQFFTALYEVTIWTQYTQHMNQVIEGLISSFLPQGNAWRLETKKGYWFVATVDGNLYSANNNFEDMSTEERIIKYTFTVKVPGYLIASRVPGAPVPVRRYVSSPEVSFSVIESGGASGHPDPFLGADDPTLPSSIERSNRPDQRLSGHTRLFPNKEAISVNDPALRSYARGTEPARYRKITGVNKKGETVTRYARVKNVNRFTGETLYSSATDLADLPIVVIND